MWLLDEPGHPEVERLRKFIMGIIVSHTGIFGRNDPATLRSSITYEPSHTIHTLVTIKFNLSFFLLLTRHVSIQVFVAVAVVIAEYSSTCESTLLYPCNQKIASAVDSYDSRNQFQYSTTPPNCSDWAEPVECISFECEIEAAMYTDRSLATLLRAIQSASDEQDLSR